MEESKSGEAAAEVKDQNTQVLKFNGKNQGVKTEGQLCDLIGVLKF